MLASICGSGLGCVILALLSLPEELERLNDDRGKRLDAQRLEPPLRCNELGQSRYPTLDKCINIKGSQRIDMTTSIE